MATINVPVIPTFGHDKDAFLDYELTWVDFLDTDTIVASTFEASDATVVLDATAPSFTNTTTLVWVKFTAGVVGSVYTITNHIITAAGRKQDQSFKVKVQEN